MAGLLKKAMDDMRDAGEAFTFLMPAAEAIYYPHGFRYIYRQKQGKVKGRKEADCKYTVSFAGKEDCAALADFVNKQITGKYQVFAKRDSHYYEVLLKEQASENGALVLVKENERLVGCFLYAKGEEYEIREPLFLPEDEEAFQNAVYLLIGNEELEVKCQAYGEEEKPLIMAKILNIPQIFECMEAVRDVNLYLEITDEPQGELPVRFRISGRERLTAAEETACLEAASLSEEPERLTIGTLTSLVFGCVDAEELAVSENFKKEWAKIKPLSKIFLNEIV